MKKFFKEYGAVTVAIFALLVLITMITPVGNIIKTSLQGTTSKFAAGMNSQTDDALDATLALQEDIKRVPIAETIYWGIDDTGKLTISDQKVGGDYSGSFARDRQFRYYDNVPWYSQRNNITFVEIIKNKDEIMPKYLDYWFYDMRNCPEMNVEKLNTSETISMKYLFSSSGYNCEVFTIVGLEKWDTSNVMDMSYIFASTGGNSSAWNIGNLSNWNTSNVTYMSYMFAASGQKSEIWNVGDLSNWDTSSVISMSDMFRDTARNAQEFNVGNIGKWNVSKVRNMNSMFQHAGGSKKLSVFYIGDLSNWNTSSVVYMNDMFCEIAISAPIKIGFGDISSWDTSNVTSMSWMFTNSCGFIEKLDLSNWNVEKVTNHSRFSDLTGNILKDPTWVN